MGVEAVLQQIGEVEKLVLEYEVQTKGASEALAVVLINLSKIDGEYGSLYHYVAEQTLKLKKGVQKLSAMKAEKKAEIEKLKVTIIKECVALRRYVSRIKT